jgi:hypothetical protein
MFNRNPIGYCPSLPMTVASDDLMSVPILIMRCLKNFVSTASLSKFLMAGVEWDCGADLSADTIEAQWQVAGEVQAA